MVSWSFSRHMPVYLADGKRLGHVVEIDHAVQYVHVQQGRLLVRDWYVPVSEIEDVSEGGVVLRSTLDGLRRHRLYIPAEDYLERQGATPGYEYTSRTDIPDCGDAAAAAAHVDREGEDTARDEKSVEAT